MWMATKLPHVILIQIVWAQWLKMAAFEVHSNRLWMVWATSSIDTSMNIVMHVILWRLLREHNFECIEIHGDWTCQHIFWTCWCCGNCALCCMQSLDIFALWLIQVGWLGQLRPVSSLSSVCVCVSNKKTFLWLQKKTSWWFRDG